MLRSRSKKEKPLDIELLTRACHIYKVLSHPVRLRIVELLMEDGLAVGELAEEMDMPQATVSQHLNLLRSNGVIAAERRGLKTFYSVVSPQANSMINCLREHADQI